MPKEYLLFCGIKRRGPSSFRFEYRLGEDEHVNLLQKIRHGTFGWLIHAPVDAHSAKAAQCRTRVPVEIVELLALCDRAKHGIKLPRGASVACGEAKTANAHVPRRSRSHRAAPPFGQVSLLSGRPAKGTLPLLRKICGLLFVVRFTGARCEVSN